MGTVSDKLYDIARKVNMGQLNTEMGYFPIFFFIMPMMIAYVLCVNSALKKTSTCGDKVENRQIEYLKYSLTVGITVPLTLVINKFFRKDIPIWLFLYGLMGLYGAIQSKKIIDDCDSTDDEKLSASLFMTGFLVAVVMGIIGFFMP